MLSTTLFLVLVLPQLRFAKDIRAQPDMCQISVVSTLKSGDQTSQTFNVPAASQKKCDVAANVYKTNFAPQTVITKTVSHTFMKAVKK